MNFSYMGVVKGLIKSSKYLICLPDETQLMPDYTSYVFAYISPAAFQKIIPAAYRLIIMEISSTISQEEKMNNKRTGNAED